MKDPKKEKNNRKTGGNYEQAAGFYLEQHGYQILQYNYRCRIGEIDIVAKEGENLVFCEVKYRTGPGKGSPLEAVDARKQDLDEKEAINGINFCFYDRICIYRMWK